MAKAKQELMEAVADNGLSTLQPYDRQIDELRDTCMALTVSSVDDKEGLAIVHEWRMKVKKLRIEVDKEGKRLREDAVKRQKLVLAEANRIIGRIEPIEEHLQEQEDIVEREKERVRQSAIEAKRKRTAERLKAFQVLGVARMEIEIAEMSDDDFAAELLTATEAWTKRQNEIAAEKERAAKERAELEKLRAEQEQVRKEQERQAAELKAKQDAIDFVHRKMEEEKAAETRRLAEIEREKKRQEELEQAKKESAERAAKAERERVEREQREAKEKADREERERQEELAARPEREKIKAIASQVSQIKVPELKRSAEVHEVLSSCVDALLAIARKR